MKTSIKQKLDYAWYLAKELWPPSFDTWMTFTAFGACIWGVATYWRSNPVASAWAGICGAWVFVHMLGILVHAIEDDTAKLRAEVEVWRNE